MTLSYSAINPRSKLKSAFVILYLNATLNAFTLTSEPTVVLAKIEDSFAGPMRYTRHCMVFWFPRRDLKVLVCYERPTFFARPVDY